MTQLTPTELRVASIAGSGYTSRRIAAELHLSPRTVEVHIRHIYEKLGIASRDELIDQFIHTNQEQEHDHE